MAALLSSICIFLVPWHLSITEIELPPLEPNAALVKYQHCVSTEVFNPTIHDLCDHWSFQRKDVTSKLGQYCRDIVYYCLLGSLCLTWNLISPSAFCCISWLSILDCPCCTCQFQVVSSDIQSQHKLSVQPVRSEKSIWLTLHPMHHHH